MVNTLESLNLSDSTCSTCGELLYDARAILLKEQREKEGKRYSNRRYALPRDYHAYCINSNCRNNRVDISFQQLIFIKNQKNLIRDVDELKENQQRILEILQKNGSNNEAYEIQEVEEVEET